MNGNTITVELDGLTFEVEPSYDEGDDQVGIRPGWNCEDIVSVGITDKGTLIEEYRLRVEKAALADMSRVTPEDWNYTGDDDFEDETPFSSLRENHR